MWSLIASWFLATAVVAILVVWVGSVAERLVSPEPDTVRVRSLGWARFLARLLQER